MVSLGRCHCVVDKVTFIGFHSDRHSSYPYRSEAVVLCTHHAHRWPELHCGAGALAKPRIRTGRWQKCVMASRA